MVRYSRTSSYASSALGYLANITCLPEAGNQDYIATIDLKETEPRDEPLYSCIPKRTTNRRRYDPGPLTAGERESILSAARSAGVGNISLIEDTEGKRALCEVIGLNDKLVFENPYLHGFLFEHIRWNDEEAQRTKDGLDIKTLELAFPDAVAFRVFRNYSVFKALNTFGISGIIANNAQKLSSSAAAIGLISIPGCSPRDYLDAGRVLQRVWLEATRLGLGFQLMTGITFLMQQVLEGVTDKLTPDNVKLIRKAYDKITGIGGTRNGTLAVMFRIGHSDPPRARSLRLPLEKIVSAT